VIKAIFFDFDGVIVESVDIKTNAFAKLFENEGYDAVQKIVDYHVRNAGVSRYDKFRYIYQEILKRYLSDNEFEMLCDQFANIVVDEVVKAPYVKGAREFLGRYASEYKCFVVSATPQKEIEDIIQKRGISHFFSAIYGAPIKKSDAVRDILVKKDIKHISAVYIGDAISDYNAAKDNVINFIARIKNNESIFADIDCIKVKDLTNLREILEKL
jgi:phosphoglycolate phosphatase-like HAD superfamily hydrolase